MSVLSDMISGFSSFSNSNLFFYVGAAVFVIILIDGLFNLLNGIRIHFLASPVDLKQKFGDWAVVTGSTDGIGQAYAHELASRGINIVLISRTLSKLEKTAKDIESQHGVKTKIIAVDLSEGKSSIEAVKNQLGDEQIGILVNNAGTLTPYPQTLTENSEEDIWAMVNLNVGFTTLLTRHLLPAMKARGRGAIVNVSSLSETSPWVLFTVYSATKIFVKYLTEGLRSEYAGSGLTFQLVSPGLVATKMTDFNRGAQKSRLLAATPAQFSRNAVRTLGLTEATAGYWLHGIQYYFASRTPVFILQPLGHIFAKMSLQTYRKQEGNGKRNSNH